MFSGTLKEFHVTSDTEKQSADTRRTCAPGRAVFCGLQKHKVENDTMKRLGFR